MKKGTTIIVLILAVAAIVVVASSAYVVDETQQALITQFGKPVGGPISEAGLHWRTPFIQKVHFFDKWLLEHDGEKTEIPTLDKKFIEIDTFARWKIVDPLLFFQSVRDEIGAKKKLDDIIDSETRNAITSHLLIEAVRNSNRPLPVDAEVAEATTSLEDLPTKQEEKTTEGGAEPAKIGEQTTIERGREKITREIFEKASKEIDRFGIVLVDVQIKAINYVLKVQEKVFERMISEREQIAEKYRAEGQKLHSEMQGKIERERNRILSEAYREAETTKGEAEAEAARIYAEAYGKDPEFYAFWKTLEIYRESLGENVSLVISTNSDLFRYLRSAGMSPAETGTPE